MMPEMSGFEVMERLDLLISEGAFLPILILTADATAETKRKALVGGATDFLTKPFDNTEGVLRIRNLLATRFLHLQLRDQNRSLEQRVQEHTVDLVQAQIEILDWLARWPNSATTLLDSTRSGWGVSRPYWPSNWG